MEIYYRFCKVNSAVLATKLDQGSQFCGKYILHGQRKPQLLTRTRDRNLGARTSTNVVA